jgi:hypothetical protein
VIALIGGDLRGSVGGCVAHLPFRGILGILQSQLHSEVRGIRQCYGKEFGGDVVTAAVAVASSPPYPWRARRAPALAFLVAFVSGAVSVCSVVMLSPFAVITA